MKNILLIVLGLFAGNLYAQPTKYVDPMIGSHDSRWIMFPGPTRPFGMVKLSPDNQELGWKAGYEYNIDNLTGFSHIHSWTMAGLLMMPTNGPLKIKPGAEHDPDQGYRSRFTHEKEKAEVGYYGVELDDYKIKAELTTTKRAGFHRYTFPANDSSRILLDLLTPSEYGYEIFYTEIKKVSDQEVEGVSYQQALRKANYNEYTLHFVLRFDKPFKAMNGWVKEQVFRDVERVSSDFGHKDVGAFFTFSTTAGEQIQAQVGISLVSIEQARLNLETEMDPFNWDFDAVKDDAQKEWNEMLSTIEVESTSEKEKTKFYTNMYRAYAGRTTWSDVNGKYVDMFEKVQTMPEGRPIYGSDGFWIAFWNLTPLWQIVTPEITSNWVNSFIEISDKGGWLPKGPTGIEYSAIMVASHQNALITGAYQMGIRDFDIEKAYTALKKLQTENGRAHDAGGYVGNRNLDVYKQYGYVPDEDGPISNTVAYAFDDWCVGQMAKSLGKEKDYKELTKRAFNYQNAFDPEVKFIRRKFRDGTWVPDFREFGDVAWLGSGYVEGNAWQYTYFVPHDLQGLISLMGEDEYVERLEKGFETSAKHNFNSEKLGSNSLEGMGELPVNHGNQPNMQAAYLFNHAGKPWLTQKWATEIMNRYYGDDPIGGWLGDEDQGQMGAWYVLSSMGLFQMDGGTAIDPIIEIGSPRFARITINLDQNYYKGNKFVIVAKGVSEKNIYVQSATLNGKKLDAPWFYAKDLTSGGELVLKMGSKPNTKWGTAKESRPPSLSTLISSEEKAEILKYDRFAEELAEWNRAVKAYYYHKKEHFESLPDTPNEIIFLGNSITDNAEWYELFEGKFNIKNRGIGGDDTDGILERLSEVTSSKPDKIFIMIGTNDLAYGKSANHVIDNYRKIIARIKSESPATELYIQAVLPVDAIHYTRPNDQIININNQLIEICREEGLTYIDLHSVFIDERGMLAKKYSIDGLHLNGQGYLEWKKVILKYLD